MSPLEEQSHALQAEALEILNGGVLGLLEREFGKVQIAGSVSLSLMVQPDIDLYTRLEAFQAPKLLDLAPKLAEQLGTQGYALAKAVLQNEHILPDPRFPNTPGLYGGFAFVHQGSGRKWSLDFWGWSAEQFKDRHAHHQQLHHDLQGADQDLILRFKNTKGYGREFFSVDVYAFAIARVGNSLEDFKRFLAERLSRE